MLLCSVSSASNRTKNWGIIIFFAFGPPAMARLLPIYLIYLFSTIRLTDSLFAVPSLHESRAVKLSEAASTQPAFSDVSRRDVWRQGWAAFVVGLNIPPTLALENDDAYMLVPQPSKESHTENMLLPEVAEDSAKSFKFQYPAGFSFFSKPAKTHFIEYNVKSNNRRGYTIGVAVDPVKLVSLEAFGTPEFVGNRIVSVEKGRDGVLGAELVEASSTQVAGITYYDIDYSNESTRGNNYYVARVAIQDGKLYALTVQTKIADYSEVAPEVKAVVRSFRVT